jgi:hypothetical protein
MDEDLRKLVEEKVSKWFGEPVLAVEDEIMALIASYGREARIEGAEQLDSDWDSYQLVDYKIDRLAELKNLKEEPTHE